MTFPFRFYAHEGRIDDLHGNEVGTFSGDTLGDSQDEAMRLERLMRRAFEAGLAARLPDRVGPPRHEEVLGDDEPVV